MAEEGRRTYGRIVPARARERAPARDRRSRSVRSPPSRRGTSRSTRSCARLRPRSPPAARSSSRDRRTRPRSCAQLIKAFVDAGVPAGVIQLVYGVPSEISEYLIPHPIIKKVTFTGSTPVGKQLAALAGAHMKRVTMELGGHAPAIVFDDADVDQAVSVLGANKFRNAGQVCVAPTRFLVHEKVYPEFVEKLRGLRQEREGRQRPRQADTQAWARSSPSAACTRWDSVRERCHRQGRQDPDRWPSQGQQGLLLRADRHDRRAALARRS